MFYAAVVEDHIHYNLDTAVVAFGYQLLILFVGAETRINFIVIGSSIAVVRTAGHVVFQYRSEPESGYTQVGEVIQILLDTCKVTTMAGVRIIAVYFVFGHAGDLVIVRITICKAVGHQQVEGVGSIKTFVFTAFLAACFQFILFDDFLFALCKSESYFTGFHIFLQSQVDNQVVRAFQLDSAAQRNAGIVDSNGRVTDVFTVDHKLEFGILHSGVPKRRVDFVYVHSCIRTKGK